MAETSTIEWTDATWNPITGCSVVSPGCTNCYAMKLAGTRLQHHPSRAGLTKPSKAGPVWTGEVRLNEEWLDQPLRWKRPRRIFVCAHGDLFHESVPDKWIDRVFLVMQQAKRHTFQVLTKRPDRMRAYLTAFFPSPPKDGYVTRGGEPAAYGPYRGPIFNPDRWPLPNVWLGISAEDQPRADERLPHLLATPAAKRFISAEPLLGLVDIAWALGHPLHIAKGFLERGQFSPGMETLRPLDWIIAGGESGPGARPMHPDWVRSLRDQCTAAGVPFFFKQWGEWAPGYDDPQQRGRFNGQHKPWVALNSAGDRGDHAHPSETKMFSVGKKAAGATLDGREWREMPNG